jgi:hypothetical protein
MILHSKLLLVVSVASVRAPQKCDSGLARNAIVPTHKQAQQRDGELAHTSKA